MGGDTRLSPPCYLPSIYLIDIYAGLQVGSSLLIEVRQIVLRLVYSHLPVGDVKKRATGGDD